MVIGWAGSSNTASASGYRPLAQAGLLAEQPRYEFSFLNISASGWATFPNLVNLADLSTADLIIFDQSNDDTADTAEVEALIRLAQASGQRVIAIVNPSWTATTDDQIDIPANLTAMTQTKTVLDAYGVTYIDGHALTQAHVAGGGHITDLWADTAHWNATGYAAVEAALDDYLPTGGAITLPASRVYAESADYENTPVIKLGTQYDSRTGTWADNGTSVSSTTVNSTITYSGTFRKFGSYRATGNNDVTVSIDGGAFSAVPFYQNGYDIGTRAAHTIVIKVVTDCKIDEFWAI